MKSASSISERKEVDSSCCFRRIRNGGVRVVWELISKCNLNCLHCFVPHTDYGIDTALALQTIDEFPSLPVRKLMFTGGEPFLRKDLLDLVEAAQRQGALVDITTNLSLVDESIIERLASLENVEITTSLDGPPETHDRIRKSPGNFAHVTSTIRKLRTTGIDVDVVCVAQADNASEISKVASIAADLGVSSLNVSGFNHQKAAGVNRDKCTPTASQEVEIAIQIREARNRYGNDMVIRTVGLIDRFEGPSPCPVEDMIAINASGKVSNCLLAPVPDSELLDLSGGLVAAWHALSRRWCCSQGGWQRLEEESTR
jgi:MoaA/NifB/PqqE/SkfB family radical SAM enzyme